MPTFPEAIAGVTRAALCSILGRVDAAASYLAPITGGAGTNAAARGLRALTCGEDGPADPAPPFIGGQCPTAYTATFQVLADSNDQGQAPKSPPNPEVVTAIGPVTVVPAQINPSIRGFKLTNPTGANFSTRYIGGNPVGLRYELTLVRQDGQPDDCGNEPLPPPAPYVPVPETVNITYEGDDNVTYNRDVNLTLLVPIINVSGTLEIPVRVDVDPDFSFDGTINFNPDFNLNLRPRGLTSEPSELPPPDPGEEDDQFIRGVVLSLQAGPGARASNLYRPPGPDLFVPRIATVTFTVGIGGSDYITVPVDVKTEACCVTVPGQLKAKAFAVSPEPGVTVVNAQGFA